MASNPDRSLISTSHNKTLGTTPAVAAGITDRVWNLNDLIGLLEEAERVPIRRGSYKKTRQASAEAISE